MAHISLEQARAAKRSALDRLAGAEAVTGVGITRVGGEYAVKVNLAEPLRKGLQVPDEIDGVKVRVEVVGSIRARTPRSPTRARPAG